MTIIPARLVQFRKLNQSLAQQEDKAQRCYAYRQPGGGDLQQLKAAQHGFPVVDVGKGKVRYGYIQKGAERFPAFLHLENEQFFCWDALPHFFSVSEWFTNGFRENKEARD